MTNPQIWFDDGSIGANYWYWNFGDPGSGLNNESNAQNPTHFFSDSGSFQVTLIAEANHGCADTITKWIIIYPEVIIYVPNAFTPDNNQLNDTWGPSVIGVLEDGYQLEIWDRWGKNLWKTNDITERWTGKIDENRLPAGVYVWVLKYKDPVGKDYKMRGTVTLVR
jgi:gliding motility-associated-like protein